jgi:lysophospholipase L1-like esterase
MHLHPYYIFSLPWTKQAREATNNDVVSANEYGFRTSIPNNSRLRAAITGGSAAFGHFSSSDGNTLASSLNRLQDRFNFENLNSPSWNSHQELIAVLKNLKRNGSSLSLTIAFTGMNDISVRTYYMQDERYKNLVDVPEAFGQLNNYFDDIRATPKSLAPPTSNRDLKTEYLLRRIFTGPPKPGAEKKWAVHASSDNSLRINEIEAISNQIVLNHEAIRKLLSANGGRHILVIQPLYGLHESSDPVMREYSEDYYEFVRGIIQRVMGSVLCKTDCINLSNVFDRYEGGASIMYGFTESVKPNYIFADEIHLTDKGVDIITVELKKYLQEKFRQP